MMRNPVFEANARRRMRSPGAPLLLTLYGLFLLAVCANALLTLRQPTLTIANLRVGIETHIYLALMQFLLIILVAPSLTAGLIAGERERQTLDLLLCSYVGPFRIVLGKMLNSLCFIVLLIVTSLPMMAVMLFFGGIGIGDMAMMLFFLTLTALACCSIGIFCSALFKRTVTATVFSYLIIFAIGIGTVVLPFLWDRASVTKLAYAGAEAIDSASVSIPLPFYLNPGIGLASMIVRQTGMLRDTLQQFLGYRGGRIFSLLENMRSFERAHMLVLAGLSALLTISAALFVKPSGRRASKR